jgi:hypothetical protein
VLSSRPDDDQDTLLRFFAILSAEPWSSGARDHCRGALDRSAVRAEITYGLLGCDVMFHQRSEDPAGYALVTSLQTVTELELNLRPASYPSSLTRWGSQFVVGARALSLQLAAASCTTFVCSAF